MKTISNLRELKKIVTEIWPKISHDIANKMMEYMRKTIKGGAVSAVVIKKE